MSLLWTLLGYSAVLPALLAALFFAVLRATFGAQGTAAPIRAVARGLLMLFRVRIRVRRFDAPEQSRTCLYIANHVSILDPLILFLVLPHNTRGVELEDHFAWPIWGSIIRMMGNIPISHRSVASAVGSLRRAEKVLAGETPVVILPEGHRTRTGEMGHFMRGPFRLARQATVPIVPVALCGLYEIKNVHSPRIHPGTVTVAIGRPVEPEAYASMSERDLATMIRNEVAGLINRVERRQRRRGPTQRSAQ